MTISSISSSAISGSQPPPISSEMRQRMRDFGSLAKAMDSGDLDSAREAFATFKQDLASSTESDPIFGDADSAASKALDAVGKALDSGDVDAAKEAFATLTDAMKASRQGGPHGPPPPPPALNSDDTTTDFSALLEAVGATGTAQSINQNGTNLIGYA